MHAWHRKWSRSLISRLFFSQAPAWRNLSIALFRICTGRFPQLNFVSWIFPQYLHDLNIWFSSGLSALVECPRWMAAALVYCCTPCKNIDPWFHSQVYKNKGRNYEKIHRMYNIQYGMPGFEPVVYFAAPMPIIPLRGDRQYAITAFMGFVLGTSGSTDADTVWLLRLPYRRGAHG